MIENTINFLQVEELRKSLAARQRPINSERVMELAKSIHARGLIHTLVVDKASEELVAGAHRLEAFFVLSSSSFPCPYPEYESWTKVPVRFAVEATRSELEAIELEENIKRHDLTWQEEAAAIIRLHELQKSTHTGWTMEKTGDLIGLSTAVVSKYLMVGDAIQRADVRVSAAGTFTAAHNVLVRQAERQIANEIELMGSVEAQDKNRDQVRQDLSGITDDILGHSSQPLGRIVAPQAIQQGDFLEFLRTYSGTRFNFLHCDFPYGVNRDKSAQAGPSVDVHGGYADTPEIYFALLEALVKGWDRILLPSSHIMFWFSMNFYEETRTILERIPGAAVDLFPLVWHKSDNKGLLPDPQRGPRRIYETAFQVSIGDRKIVQAVANHYSCPTTKDIHISEKPESMLRHFFRMYVDESTKMLDGTCGSGSSVRAAQAMGADYAMGLELDADMASAANDMAVQAQTLRNLSASTHVSRKI